MEKKECKIICEGKEIGTITCDENSFSVKTNENWKKMCKDCC